jgi:diadenosine tetraphosphate (Ap4A) HIT family hydrolase
LCWRTLASYHAGYIVASSEEAAGVSDCLPCDLEAAEPPAVVYRDETWSCEIAGGYEVPGWFMLRLRRHAEGWSGPTSRELADFGPISQRVAAAIESATGATGVYFMSFGENYPHFHFLVIARDAQLPPEYRGAAVLGLRAEGRDLDAALAVGARVRDALAAAAL